MISLKLRNILRETFPGQLDLRERRGMSSPEAEQALLEEGLPLDASQAATTGNPQHTSSDQSRSGLEVLPRQDEILQNTLASIGDMIEAVRAACSGLSQPLDGPAPIETPAKATLPSKTFDDKSWSRKHERALCASSGPVNISLSQCQLCNEPPGNCGSQVIRTGLSWNATGMPLPYADFAATVVRGAEKSKVQPALKEPLRRDRRRRFGGLAGLVRPGSAGRQTGD